LTLSVRYNQIVRIFVSFFYILMNAMWIKRLNTLHNRGTRCILYTSIFRAYRHYRSRCPSRCQPAPNPRLAQTRKHRREATQLSWLVVNVNCNAATLVPVWYWNGIYMLWCQNNALTVIFMINNNVTIAHDVPKEIVSYLEYII